MLQSTAGDRFAGRLGLTFFDLLVFVAIGFMLLLIAITMVFGMTTPPDEYVVYLQMDERGLYEIWATDPTKPDEPHQITDTENGIWEYDVSGDGRYIVYSVMDFTTGGRELFIFDTAANETTQITNCIMQDADCYAPKFNASATAIAYERASLNSTSVNIGIGAPRIWLIDLTQSPPSTFPLVEDNTVLGTSATWAADGSRVAFYDNSTGGIVIYAVDDSSVAFVPTRMGLVGALSPDGEALVYPDMVNNRGSLQLADLSGSGTLLNTLTDPGEEFDEQFAVWHPSGEQITFGRRAPDERGTQIYTYDVATGTVQPLLRDIQFNHGGFSWDADGEQLVMARFQQMNADGTPYTEGTLEVWTFDTTSGQLTRIARNALNPLWIAPFDLSNYPRGVVSNEQRTNG